jgi:signal transduction histidine kinase
MTVHFGMWLSRPTADLWTLLGFYSAFFWLGWSFPMDRSKWQRLFYVVTGLGMTIAARCAGIDLGLFLFFYLAKSYFLLNRQITFRLCLGMAIPWVVSEYFVELAQLPVLPASSSPSLNMVLGTSAVYAAASVFALMCCAMVLADEQSRYQISELSEQVESLATSLERTRIAREIHDSLGHTLTDLDIQLALAQKLRLHDINRSFQAVDTRASVYRRCQSSTRSDEAI